MSKGCSEEKHDAIQRHAADVLKVLLKDLEDKYGCDDYEVEFIGDLYARMIISVYMGYSPDVMGESAEDAAIRLMKASGVDMEEIEHD